MYIHAQIAHEAKLAALDLCNLTGSTLFDTNARWFDLCHASASKVVGLPWGEEPAPSLAQYLQLAPELIQIHLRNAGFACEDLLRLVEAHIHSSTRIAKFALDKAADMSPPLVEIAIDTTESILSAGEEAADALGDASLMAIGHGKKEAARFQREPARSPRQGSARQKTLARGR